MADIPGEWRAYALKQAELDRRSFVDAKAWGLEAGLNQLLDSSITSDAVDRTVASAARRSRYAQSLLAKYMRINVSLDGVSHLEARSALNAIETTLPITQVAILTASLNQLSMLGAERTKLSRARKAARSLVA